VEGPKGKLSQNIHDKVIVEVKDNQITVKNADNSKLSRSLFGLTRTLINNMIIGVTTGYEKKLEIVGVGYRVALKGKNLDLSLGFSHPVIVEPLEGIEFAVEGQNKITVKGIDKQLVGQVAADIRKLRKPEPYKGKGIRYAGEYILRKAGKAGK
jgi:large subunit ribosomal protein L6